MTAGNIVGQQFIIHDIRIATERQKWALPINPEPTIFDANGLSPGCDDPGLDYQSIDGSARRVPACLTAHQL
jgi:hypothetical protein